MTMDNNLSRILVSIDSSSLKESLNCQDEMENSNDHSSESIISGSDSDEASPPQCMESLKEASGPDLIDKFRKKFKIHEVMTSKREPNSFKKVVRLPTLPYRCFSCSLTTSDLETLAEHCEVVHKDDLVIPCQFCVNFQAPLVKLVLHHAQKHNKLEYLAFCESKSAVTENLIASQYIHEDLYTCLKCEFSEKSFSLLKSHVKEVHNDTIYQCLQCDFKAANMPSLKNHISVNHIEEEPFKCIACNFKSSSSGTVVRHIRRHKGLVGIKSCSMCSFKTELISDLRIHVRKHILKESYQCFLCNEIFHKAVDVSCHFQRSHGIKLSTELNKCAQCDLIFHHHKDLIDHESEKHSQCKPYTCKMCECSFSTVKQFTKHSTSVHERNDFENNVIFLESYREVFMDTFQMFINSEPSNSNKHCKRTKSKRSEIYGEYECHSCNFKSHSNTDLADHIKITHLCGKKENKFENSPVKLIESRPRNRNCFIEEERNDCDISMGEVLESMEELSPNTNMSNCVSKSENSTGEISPTNRRRSSRKRVIPFKYEEVAFCEICNFVAKSPVLLKKHIAIFHKRKLQSPFKEQERNIISEKFLKVRLERLKFIENLTKTEQSTQIIENTSHVMRNSKRKEFPTNESDNNSTGACNLNIKSPKLEIYKNDDDSNFHSKSEIEVSKRSNYVKKCRKELDQEMDPANHSIHYRQCHLCDFQSVRADILLTHVTQYHMEAVGKKTCYHCQLQFDDLDRLKFHAAVAHDENEAFHCGLCGLCIPTSHLLEAHLYYKHRRKMTLKCIHCLRTFDSVKLMKYHMKDHIEGSENVTGGLFPCAYCSFCSNNGKLFRKHVKSKHPKCDTFQCKYCSHIGQSMAHYKKHMFELHHKIRQFNCPFCDYCTGRRELLQNHLQKLHKTN